MPRVFGNFREQVCSKVVSEVFHEASKGSRAFSYVYMCAEAFMRHERTKAVFGDIEELQGGVRRLHEDVKGLKMLKRVPEGTLEL